MARILYKFGLLGAILLPATVGLAGSYSGPLGLPWGVDPEKAKILLTKRMDFVREWDGEGDEAYVTTEQLYTELFGGLPARDIQLKFYDRKFFYLTVVLKPIAKPTRIFDEVVAKMTEKYGEPKFKSKPKKLFSSGVNLYEYPVESPNKEQIVAMFQSGGGAKKTEAHYDLMETLMRMGQYDPLATWKFSNRVTIQTFILPRTGDDGVQRFENLWIFSKDDKRETWFESKMRPPKIEDY